MNDTLPRPEHLHSFFDSQVPQDVQRALTYAVAEGYAATLRSCEQRFDPRMVDQAWRFKRWLWLDNALLDVGKRFEKRGVKADFVENTPGTEVKHVELRIGRIIITAASVPNRNTSPRRAAYRDTLAGTNQKLLFETPILTPKSPTDVWTPLLHIPDTTAKKLGGAYIAFPTLEDGFACEHIDLLARFPLGEVAVERIQDEASPQPRMLAEHGA